MGKTIRLKDKTGPGIKEVELKEVKGFIDKKPKMRPFDKNKERI